MKYLTTLPLMASTAVLLTACGGGGSSIVTPSTSVNYKVTGTVPGTLIEAFCDDGSYHSVNSVTNGTNQHPFALTLPKDLRCRLVMTINEGSANKVITAIKLNDGSNSNIAFSSGNDIDLGHVDLALETTPALDSDNDRVIDIPQEVTLAGASATTVQISAVGTSDLLDNDNDGIINVYEDDDNDGINNHDDDDDDGNGIKDIEEIDNDNDLDNDGISNDIDVDDDNDGLDDSVDSDDDNDGFDDSIDNDDDNDGIDDSVDADNNDGVNDSNDSDSNNSDSDNDSDSGNDSDNDSNIR